MNADLGQNSKKHENEEQGKEGKEESFVDSASPPYPLAERLEPYEGFRRVRQMSLSFSTIT